MQLGRVQASCNHFDLVYLDAFIHSFFILYLPTRELCGNGGNGATRGMMNMCYLYYNERQDSEWHLETLSKFYDSPLDSSERV